jgi:GMP synthase-like glutamine amidotransferase
MIAKACGVPVTRAPVKEVGWGDVWLTDVGRRDPLFQGLPERFRVFQWHEDTFEVPTGGTLLTTSNECPHQAFRYRNAYGLQFHIEVTREIVVEWSNGLAQQCDFIREFEEIEHSLFDHAKTIYTNFVTLIGTSNIS